jgi:hypothetical protein
MGGTVVSALLLATLVFAWRTPVCHAISVVYLDENGDFSDRPVSRKQAEDLAISHYWWSDRDPSELSQSALEGGGWKVDLFGSERFPKITIEKVPKKVKKDTAAVIQVLDGDDPGEGFNDPTPAFPVGGNTGTTIGEQRFIAFQYAADIWAALLSSDVVILVSANFDPLPCTSSSAILGSAGPMNVVRDFTGAPFSDTWYPVALGNALVGNDLIEANADIHATFNSQIDNNDGCLSGTNWYYGLDGNSGRDIDFVSIIVHEVGHGLGFLTYVDGQTGKKYGGFDDVFMQFLQDNSLGLNWPDMTDAQRAASALDTGDLVWSGVNVDAAASNLSQGLHSSGHVEMYAPSPYEVGSSVSHFSNVVFPNEVMEPAYTGPRHDPGLAYDLFIDLGWPVTTLATPTPTATNTQVPPTPTATETETPTSTPTNTEVAQPTDTASQTPTTLPTNTPIPTSTNTKTATDTPPPTRTHTPSWTATLSYTPTATSSTTPTPTDTSTPTTTQTPTWTLAPTDTQTPVPTHSTTPTNSPLPSATPTEAAPPTPTQTNTSTVTPTATPTMTPTVTEKGTETPAPSSTPSATDSPATAPTDVAPLDPASLLGLLEAGGTKRITSKELFLRSATWRP